MKSGMIMLILGAAFVALGCSPKVAPSAMDTMREYDAAKTDTAPRIDGRLDDPCWVRAAWTERFVDIEGGSKPAPRFDTDAAMSWDDEYFYFAARMEEPNVHGWMTERDMVIWHENDFEIFIDPDGDRAKYFEIEINALNTIFDLFLHRTYIDGGPADHDWDCAGLKSAVAVYGTLNDPRDVDSGWTVEIAVPWAALEADAGMACPPTPGDTWRVNFSRVEWQWAVEGSRIVRVPDTPENNWVWSPQGVINMHLPEYWGAVRFIEPTPYP